MTGNAIDQSPETMEDPGSVWAGAGTSGVAEAETTVQPTAKAETAPVRIEAGPVTGQVLEDDQD